MGELRNPRALRTSANEQVPGSQPRSPLAPSRNLTGGSTVLEGIAGAHQIGRNVNAGIEYWVNRVEGTNAEGAFNQGVQMYHQWWNSATGRADWPSWEEIRAEHYSGSMYGMGPSAATRESYRIMRTGTARESIREALRVDRGSLFRYGMRSAPWAYNFYTGQGPAARIAGRPRIETSIPNPSDPLSRAIPRAISAMSGRTFKPEEQEMITDFGLAIYGMVSEVAVPDPDGSSGLALMAIGSMASEMEATTENALGGAPKTPAGGTMMEEGK
mgnify:CR=1 FL=1